MRGNILGLAWVREGVCESVMTPLSPGCPLTPLLESKLEPCLDLCCPLSLRTQSPSNPEEPSTQVHETENRLTSKRALNLCKDTPATQMMTSRGHSSKVALAEGVGHCHLHLEEPQSQAD